MLRIMCCGRPCFERLLQLSTKTKFFSEVVEDLVLKGYYNHFGLLLIKLLVVEDLVLKGYYNVCGQIPHSTTLWKTLF
mgnify:CR=1 FL=1